MGIIIYAISWLIFAAVHSLLARQKIQKTLETVFHSYYRLAYNILAFCKIITVLYIGKLWMSDMRLSSLNNSTLIFSMYSIQLLGVFILALSLLAYDVGRFSGITQALHGEKVTDPCKEPFQRKFLNRWVRHPLYTGAFLVLWGGAVSELGIWTAVFGTLYLIIGTRYEERKLLKLYGAEYHIYQQEVPRYFPSIRRHS